MVWGFLSSTASSGSSSDCEGERETVGSSSVVVLQLSEKNRFNQDSGQFLHSNFVELYHSPVQIDRATWHK